MNLNRDIFRFRNNSFIKFYFDSGTERISGKDTEFEKYIFNLIN
jgi:hypothetical protein